MPFVRELAADRTVNDLLHNLLNHDLLRSRGLLLPFARTGAERLDTLRIVAIDSHGLQTQAPAFHVGDHDIFGGAFFRHVYGLRNRAGDEGCTAAIIRM